MPRGAIPRELYQDRLAAVELAMIRRTRTMRIVAQFTAEWGIKDRQVLRYMEAVRKKWREEAAADPNRRERERDHMRQSLNDLYSQAMQQTEVVRDAKGNPVPQLDASGKPRRDAAGNVMYQVMRTPDLGAASQVARTLIDLDGLRIPPKLVLDTPQGGLTVTHNISPEARAGLEGWLKGHAPTNGKGTNGASQTNGAHG